MKTPRLAIFGLRRRSGRPSAPTPSPRSSGHESALTLSRDKRTVSLATHPVKPLRPFHRLNGTGSRKSQIVNRKSQEGIALIITLILLAVTLVMAIAFLAISRRERNSVSGTEDAAAAKYADDAALNRAEARIVTQMLTTTNPYVFSLIVSTNFINQAGFTSGFANLTNVNYDHYINSSAPLDTAQDIEQNIANLDYNPRPPVYYSNDFRFYLDLNRNGRYDTNGWVTNIDNDGNGLGSMSFQVGDPEWIGVLEHPGQPHGPNNRFIARFCFIAVPANSLDFNSIHNQTLETLMGSTVNPPSAVTPVTGTPYDGYWRDQGVGTWELNLAAFLTDLNTNRWDPPTPWNPSVDAPYSFPETRAFPSIAFDDARALVAWRYTNSYFSLASARQTFGLPGYNAFTDFGIDSYGVGQQSTLDANFEPYYVAGGYGDRPWAGAQNYNDYFQYPSDLFDTNKAYISSGGNLENGYSSFAYNVYSAGIANSTYDRYTFYRMLAQLGTDTQPAQDKINLNYQNALINYDFNAGDIARYGAAVTNIALGITLVPNMETNFLSWRPKDFFTVAANQMLHAYTTEWFEASPSNYIQNYYGIPFGYSYTNLDGLNVTNIQYLGQTNQIPSFGVTNIPVYVNGSFVYSPAINRILQLAANIYDASTNTSTLMDSNYPSVFRPVFERVVQENYFLRQYFTNVYITGYQYVPEPLNDYPGSQAAITAVPQELTALPFNSTPNFPVYCTSNVWGVPWIVGVKKGLPNFNGCEFDSTFFIERELQFTRDNTTPQPTGTLFPYGRTYKTNQMYIMGVTNAFAAENLNSYVNPYHNQITIYGHDELGFALTNSYNLAIANTFSTDVWNWAGSPVTFGLPVPTWPGQYPILPFGPNVAVMQNLAFFPSPPSTNNLYTYYATRNPTPPLGNPPTTYTGPCFIPNSANPPNYLDPGTPQLPQFGLMETNHLQAYMLDVDQAGNVHILDYVQLGSMNDTLNINAAIDDPDETGLWSTNPASGSDIPDGVINQFNTSSIGGTVPAEDSDIGPAGQWTARFPGAWGANDPPAQAYFSAFFTPDDIAYDPVDHTYITNNSLSVQASFTPMREIVQRYVLRANDPVVHYLSSDLNDIAEDSSNRVSIATNQPPIKYIGQTNHRYMPWNQTGTLGTLNNVPADNNSDNLSYKDAMVTSPDFWDFQTNKYPTVGWLDRVHRGTPWQTVFLKSTNIWELHTSANGGPLLPTGAATWQLWTGDMNADDAYNEIPAQDRLLFDLFTAAPDDNAMRGQVSVNIGADDPTNDPLDGLASWSALLSGSLVVSNNANPLTFGFHTPNPPAYTTLTIQPLGVPPYPGSPVGSITNDAMWQIVNGINSTRTNFTAIDGLHGVFEHVGDILATPQLSDASPFLQQLPNSANNEMYDWLPQQMLGLMTVSGTPQNPPRYVIYCYGQALKPAPNGIVTSGSFFGLCTNYQVVAESASRVVIRVENAPTPANPAATPRIVVEQYNPLPPD